VPVARSGVVSDVLKEIADIALKKLAQTVDGFEVNTCRRLVVEKRNRISVQSSFSGDIDDFHLPFAHHSG
jgi:hypothetical protein